MDNNLTRAQRASDAVTWFCGSWTFVNLAACFTASWLVWNVHSGKSFDPYPFILLNLVFTVVELFQGPLIMMSQNREIERDREVVQGIHIKLDEIKEYLKPNNKE